MPKTLQQEPMSLPELSGLIINSFGRDSGRRSPSGAQRLRATPSAKDDHAIQKYRVFFEFFYQVHTSHRRRHRILAWASLPSTMKPSKSQLPISSTRIHLRDNHPDPYGIKDFEAMEEAEDETDTAPPPLVILCAGLEVYIDLNAPKLKRRFASGQGEPEQTPAQPAKKPTNSNAKWDAKGAEWDASAW
ncbi:hypothetical protein K438DRAFT_1761685 [Mycena galopus ATCC 62051]|nr:hypothetical protein K438DRAFT_1761685 [Mycena galopus ATCC 62051]